LRGCAHTIDILSLSGRSRHWSDNRVRIQLLLLMLLRGWQLLLLPTVLKRAKDTFFAATIGFPEAERRRTVLLILIMPPRAVGDIARPRGPGVADGEAA